MDTETQNEKNKIVSAVVNNAAAITILSQIVETKTEDGQTEQFALVPVEAMANLALIIDKLDPNIIPKVQEMIEKSMKQNDSNLILPNDKGKDSNIIIP